MSYNDPWWTDNLEDVPVKEPTEPSYTAIPERTVATSPSARTRKAIRCRIEEGVKRVDSIYISAEQLRLMTDSQIQEALGVVIHAHVDSEHTETARVLDLAALAAVEALTAAPLTGARHEDRNQEPHRGQDPRRVQDCLGACAVSGH